MNAFRILLSVVKAVAFAVWATNRVCCAPLQWEEIKPVGDGPAARHSHVMASFDTSQDSIFLFGGTSGTTAYGDMWTLDAARQGWSPLSFPDYQVACERKRINERRPGSRSGHAMASSGSIALMCGGQPENESFWNVTKDQVVQIECWWFYPHKVPVWAELLLVSRSKAPIPRIGTVMVFDDVRGNFVLYGGLASTRQFLNDCWLLSVDTNLTAEQTVEVEYEWRECGPAAEGTFAPSARTAHQAVFVAPQRSMFMFGGFEAVAADGSFFASRDMWRLDAYEEASAWRQVLSTSALPPGRAFHAMWLVGVSIWIHGGEGYGGTGARSVLGDTWSFDIYTSVWTQFGTSDAVPFAARMSAVAIGSEAYCFGGLDLDGYAMGILFTFTAADGWHRVKAAGPGPSDRAAHAAAFEPGTSSMVIYGGANGAGAVLGDVWVFKDHVWRCLQGEEDACQGPVDEPPFGPGPRLMHGGAAADLMMFVFGGANRSVCVAEQAEGGGSPGMAHTLTSDFWALDLATHRWWRVESGGANPPPRMLHSMSYAREDGASSFASALALAGGATLDCEQRSGSPCPVPQPMNDLYYIDTRRRPTNTSMSEAGTDRVAVFDGRDDVLQIRLPSVCANVESMSVLWIEAWIYTSGVGSVKSVLVDAYAGETSVLRWWFEYVNEQAYIRLSLHPDGDSRLVKTWGPMTAVLYGHWHHMAFTLRFARVFQAASTSPGAAITQAFLFVDAALQQESGASFVDIDIEKELVLNTGLTDIFVAGPNPALEGSGFSHFRGSVDNLRVWWPSCPHSNDPTRCNPYGFLYPKLADGTRVPASGVHDDQVTLQMVATPVWENMMEDELPWDAENGGPGEGCLVFLDFNQGADSGFMEDKSRWVFDICTDEAGESVDPTQPHCEGCDASCTFFHCGEFDMQCASRGVDETEQLRRYGQRGSCECLSVEGCPTAVRECSCPEGTHRVCTECRFRYMDDEGLECDIAANPLTCFEIHPAFCPREGIPDPAGGLDVDPCVRYECSCFDPLTNSGLFVDDGAAPETSGDYCAGCPAGKMLTSSRQPVAEDGVVLLRTFNLNATHQWKCCELPRVKVACLDAEWFLDDAGTVRFECHQWRSIEVIQWAEFSGVLDFSLMEPGSDNNCGIEYCCIEDSSVPTGATTADADDDVQCSSFLVGDQAVVTCEPNEAFDSLDRATWTATLTEGELILRRSDAAELDGPEAAAAAQTQAVRAKDRATQACGHDRDGSDRCHDRPRRAAQTPGAPAASRGGGDSSLQSPLSASRRASWDEEVNPLRAAQQHDLQEFESWHTYIAWNFVRNATGAFPSTVYNDWLTRSTAEQTSWVQGVCDNVTGSEFFCPWIDFQVVTRPAQHFESYSDWTGGSWEASRWRTVVKMTPLSVRWFVESSGPFQALQEGLAGMGFNVSGVEFFFEGSYCSNGVVEAGEVCDSGKDQNNFHSSCNWDCTCNSFGGYTFDDVAQDCVCDASSSGFTYSVRESSVEQGALNTIEVAVFMWDSEGVNFPPTLSLGNLTGSPSPSGEFELECSWAEGATTISHSSEIGFCAPLGLPPICDPCTDSEVPYRFSRAKWNQATGTLSTVLLQPPQDNLCGPLKSCDPIADFETAHVRFRFTLRNPNATQTAVHPELRFCQSSAMQPLTDETSTPILGARLVRGVQGQQQVEVFGTDGARLAFVALPEPLPGHGHAWLAAGEAAVHRQLTQEHVDRLPAGAAFTALGGRVLDVGFEGGLSSPATVGMGVDESKRAVSGGCMTTADKSLRVCVPGWTALHQYDEQAARWWPLPSVTRESGAAQTVEAAVDALSKFAVVSTVPCCNSEGRGRACGDRVCVWTVPGDAAAVPGAGTSSKMPAMEQSTRPRIRTLAELWRSFNASAGAHVYHTRSPWRAVRPNEFYGCASKRSWDTPVREWMPARFAHAMTGVSATRSVVYGGIGCNRYSSDDPCTRICVELTVLSDLWEWDTLAFTAGAWPWTKHELSPQLDGLAAAIGIPLPGLHSEFIVLGGSKTLSLVDIIQGKQASPEVELFEYRRLKFREGKVENISMPKFSSFISHSAVFSRTAAVVFGGYVRNRVTSAMLVFDLTAATPSIALDRHQILARGPRSRAFPALIKPNAFSLVMYGGVGEQYTEKVGGANVNHPATNELWHLDLSRQQWTKVHDADVPTGPPRVSFYATAAWVWEDHRFILVHGGILGGYATTPGETIGQMQAEGYVWPSQSYQTADQEKWYGFRSRTVFPGHECCDPNADLPPSCGQHPVKGCSSLFRRAMHAGVPGKFVAGADSILLYGGYDQAGRVTRDLLYYDAEVVEFSFRQALVLRGVRAEAVGDGSVQAWMQLMIMNGVGSQGPDQENFQLICPSIAIGAYDWTVVEHPDGHVDGVPRIVVRWVSKFEVAFFCFFRPFFADTEFPGRPDLVYNRFRDNFLNGTVLQDSWLDWNEQDKSYESCARDFECDEFYQNRQQDGLMDSWQYSDRKDCKTACRRGLCQGQGNVSGGTAERNSDGDLVYCYGAGNQCGRSYQCGLPLERAGHRMSRFVLGGTSNIMLMFGGEKNDLRSDIVAELSNEVHAALFSPSTATFTKLWVSAADGSECDALSCAESNCPCPRRDAPMDVIRNTGSRNGKLILFGGMTTAGQTSPGWAYLHRVQAAAVLALNDLWYLDLDALTLDCLENGRCERPLAWTKVDLPGTQVPARWGAGMVLDTSDNLYITGGATVDAEGAFTELGDLYVFQLLDPFYRKCSATGKGLTQAVAGRLATFFLQCQDALGGPADGARFEIDISGPVDMSPAVLSQGGGQYTCSYLAVKASSDYKVTIKVGRGGDQFQDLISGVDADATDSVHDYRGSNGDLGVTNPNPFSLKVEPGSTDPATSYATGVHFSLTTAGVISSFTLLARDSFLNRRPGGDSISVIMEAWDNQTQMLLRPTETPKTATVTDNFDGSYSAVYTITQGGVYRVSITFAGVYGAQTPALLTVDTATAATERTYVYGEFLRIRAGSSSAVWVQTRDKYGNALRVHPLQYPSGSEPITFELCKSTRDRLDQSCRGGVPDTNVGVTIGYSYGPDGKRTIDKTLATGGTPYWGLYRIEFYPYGSGAGYTIEVLHNKTRVACYFNTQSDPGGEAADACIQEVQAIEDFGASQRRGRDAEGLAAAGRRQSSPLVHTSDRQTQIETAFVAQDTTLQLRWLWWTPFICIVFGVLLEVVLTIRRRFRRKEEKKLQKELELARFAQDLAEADSSPTSAVHSNLVFPAASQEMKTTNSRASLSLEGDGSACAPARLAEAGAPLADAQRLVGELQLRGWLSEAEAAAFAALGADDQSAQHVLRMHASALIRAAHAIRAASSPHAAEEAREAIAPASAVPPALRRPSSPAEPDAASSTPPDAPARTVSLHPPWCGAGRSPEAAAAAGSSDSTAPHLESAVFPAGDVDLSDLRLRESTADAEGNTMRLPGSE